MRTYPPPIERFLAGIEVIDQGYRTPCWVWQRATNNNGYGSFTMDGRSIGIHVFAYQEWVGPIPEGHQIDHLCRIHPCGCPDHPEAVTCRTNLLRGETVTAAHAAATCCPMGHEYTPENTYWRRQKRGWGRMCIICMRSRTRARRAA